MPAAKQSEVAMRRMRWRCRRGMRELDMLLLKYVDSRYEAAQSHQQKAFRYLLTLPDPDILALLTGRAQAEDGDLHDVVQCLLAADSAD
jgi:antitoxin CptB